MQRLSLIIIISKFDETINGATHDRTHDFQQPQSKAQK